MKKTLAIVLALLMAASLIAFTACGKKETVTDDSDNKDVQNEQNVGENASTDVVSRSVARESSYQKFDS